MTNKELLKIADELLDSCYRKQPFIINNKELCNDLTSQCEKYIRKLRIQQHNQHKQIGHRTTICPDPELISVICTLKIKIGINSTINVGNIIAVCDIINNDELTENVKNEIKKNLSDEYKLMRLLISIVKKQEEKLEFTDSDD
jgi:hypothetical protein